VAVLLFSSTIDYETGYYRFLGIETVTKMRAYMGKNNPFYFFCAALLNKREARKGLFRP